MTRLAAGTCADTESTSKVPKVASSNNLQMLTGMGFRENSAKQALVHSFGNLHSALDFLAMAGSGSGACPLHVAFVCVCVCVE